VSIGVPKLGTFKVSNFILGNVKAMVTAQRSVVTMTPQVAKAAMDPSSETQFVLQEDPQFWNNSEGWFTFFIAMDVKVWSFNISSA